LKERGWTRTLIATFLGQPDYASCCPAGGRPAGLYLSYRVVAAELTVPWQRAVNAARGKAAAAQAAASGRRLNLLRYAERIELRVPPWTFDELVDRARSAVSVPLLQVERDGAVRSQVLALALEAFSDADARLDIYQRSAGIREARMRLLQRKLVVVADRYPALAPLCRDAFPEGPSPYDVRKAA
jgi:hypothetical protein